MKSRRNTPPEDRRARLLAAERMTETFRTYMQAEQERTRRANAEHRAKTWLN